MPGKNSAGNINDAREESDPGGKEMKRTPPARSAYPKRQRKDEKWMGAECTGLTPVEARMCDQDGETAEDKNEEGRSKYPVSAAHGKRIPITRRLRVSMRKNASTDDAIFLHSC
jgi:hypothetical protein